MEAAGVSKCGPSMQATMEVGLGKVKDQFEKENAGIEGSEAGMERRKWKQPGWRYCK